MFEAVPLPSFSQSTPASTVADIERLNLEANILSTVETDEQPEISWTDVKSSFGAVRERLRGAKYELKALGNLAVLNLDGAQASLADIQPAHQPEPESMFKPMSLKERIHSHANRIHDEQIRRRRGLRSRTLGYLAAAGSAASTGFFAARFLN